MIGDLTDPDQRQPLLAKWGLGLFLAVVGALFALLASAYVMRAVSPDWRRRRCRRVLWLNTGVLIVSSIALQAAASFSARRYETERARFFLLAGAGAAFAFLAGQLWAWRQFAAAGYFLSANPADAFFYLITGAAWRASGRGTGRAGRDRRLGAGGHRRGTIRDQTLRDLLAFSADWSGCCCSRCWRAGLAILW